MPTADHDPTLHALFEATQPYLPATQVKDIKTSLKYLAQALGKPDAAHCLPSDYQMPLPDLKARLTAFFASWDTPPSRHTIHNTRHNISVLLRQATAAGVMPAISRPAQTQTLGQIRHESRKRNPHRSRFIQPSYWLPVVEWPAALRARWDAYAREVELQIRPITLKERRGALQRYVGFLTHIQPTPIQHWEELFEVTHVDHFLRWQAKTHQVRILAWSIHFVDLLYTIAWYQQLPQAGPLRDYRRRLPPATPLHDKQYHMPTIPELEQVANYLLQEGSLQLQRHHAQTHHPGLRSAIRFQRGLMLKLLIRIPMRSRTLREMQFDRHLFKADGRWRLLFGPEDLKIAQRRGRPNKFDPDWPEDLVAPLETFRTTYRPRFPKADRSPVVFLTQKGNPFNGDELHDALNGACLQYLGKRFYPHWMRTIYTTVMLERGVPIETVAAALNDTPRTLHQAYYETRARQHYGKAQEALQDILRQR
jgi:hypothetical protein